jgi:hypothetical protein
LLRLGGGCNLRLRVEARTDADLVEIVSVVVRRRLDRCGRRYRYVVLGAIIVVPIWIVVAVIQRATAARSSN